MDAPMPSKLPILVVLLLASLLLAANTAHGVPGDPSAVPSAVEEDLEFELEDEETEGAEESSECDEAEEEFEEGELGGNEVEAICDEGNDRKRAASGSAPPEECLLKSTHVRAVANDEGDKLKLTLGYTTYEPANATVEIHRGSTRIGTVHRHLGRTGVLRITERLGKKPAAKKIVVRIRIPSSPQYCGRFQTETARIR